MSEKLTRPPANKLLGLELLRFVAAFGVLIWHYQHFAYVGGKAVGLVREQLPFYGLLQWFYDGGLYGVWIFWCISGFIFFWKYREPIDNRSIGAKEFFVFRFSRLYPLHLVTLLLVAGLQVAYFHLNDFFFVYQANDLRHFLLQVLMASNWGFEHGDSFDGPIWSISVEVLVYVVFFVMLRFVTGSALLNVVIIIACVNARLIHAPGMVFDCLAFFYIGGLAAIARRAVAAAQRGAIDNVAWAVLGVFCLLSWSFALARFDLFAYGFLLIGTPILLFCISRDISVSAATQRLIEAAGNMTYSSYLLHFPIQLVIALGFAIVGAPIPYYHAAFFVIFVTTTLLASYLTYRGFEAPAQNIIRRRLLRRPGNAMPVAALAEIGRAMPRKAD